MLEQVSMPAWLDKYGIRTEADKPIDLRSHLFLFDIYADMSPKQVTMKAAQIGMSTAQILKTIWMAKMRGYSVAYVLPTYGDALEFSSTKTGRIIQANPILRTYVEDGDTTSVKRVGKANIFYRGSFTEKQAISFTADLLCMDEVDRSDQSVLATYSSRLQHSDYKGEWYFSNPSVEGNGVSRYWGISDQKHWFITCPHCRERQYLSWPDSVDIEKGIYVCVSCGKELDPETRRKGQWVKKYADREYSGYWISLLMAPWVTAKEIIAYWQTKPIDFFHNFVLGLPYVGEGNTVSPEMLFRNCTSTVNSQDNVVIGCDSGLVKHYVLGNSEGLFYAGKTESWGTIESLMSKYPGSVAVIDALPDLTEPRKLREKYPGRVYLCHYSKDRKTFQTIKWGRDMEEGNVNADRNRLMQIVVDEFGDGRIPLQGNRDDWAEYYSHWKSMYRLEEKDAMGNPFFKWESSNNVDHWCHATAYWRIGMERFGMSKAETIGSGLSLPGIKEGYEIGLDGTVPAPDMLKRNRMLRRKDWRL